MKIKFHTLPDEVIVRIFKEWTYMTFSVALWQRSYSSQVSCDVTFIGFIDMSCLSHDDSGIIRLAISY